VSRDRHGNTARFEALAADIVRDRRGSVEFNGVRFDVVLRVRRFDRRVSLFTYRDGVAVHRIDITGYHDWVEVVADYLMFIAAEMPGIVVPPSG
jgi:hypothetical protein